MFEYSQKPLADIAGFLEYFKKKEGELSISSPQDQSAIKIMTIHKSKGLEFPIVIFPFADLDIYREKEAMSWLPLDEEQHNGFSHLLINHNKNTQHYSKESLEIYNQHKAELELDNINLLYVVMTRAVEQLYVVSKLDVSSKGIPKPNTYSGKLIAYLQHSNHWDASQTVYTFGTPEKVVSKKDVLAIDSVEIDLISTSKDDHKIDFATNSGLLWNTDQNEAIEKGNLLHDLMALVTTKGDIENAIDTFIDQGIISTKQSVPLKRHHEYSC